MDLMQMETHNSITRAMIACYHGIMSIRKTTKKKMKEVQSLRKLKFLSNPPRGLYFIAQDGNAYVCDTLGFKGAQEIADFNKQMKKDIEAQIKLL